MLVSDQFSGQPFYQLVGNCRDHIRLVMPTISSQDADNILEVKRKEAKLELITGYSIEDFIGHNTELSALKKMVESNGKIMGLPGLQGSFCLFDNQYALVNSGPITKEGYGSSKKYGVLVDNRQVINSMIHDYEDLIQNGNPRIIDSDRIESIEYSLQVLSGGKLSWTWDPERIKRELQLSGWSYKIFDCLLQIPGDEFLLADVYEFSDQLSKYYPLNNHVEAKIRQQLQVLRDKGLVEFLERGKYRKLKGLRGL